MNNKKNKLLEKCIKNALKKFKVENENISNWLDYFDSITINNKDNINILTNWELSKFLNSNLKFLSFHCLKYIASMIGLLRNLLSRPSGGPLSCPSTFQIAQSRCFSYRSSIKIQLSIPHPTFLGTEF